MKKLTYLSGIALMTGLLALSSQATAQITITSVDLPSAGLAVVTEEDSTSGLVPGAPSSSAQFWNFSTLGRQKAANINFMLPGSTPYGATFAAANLADSTVGGNGYNFFSLNSSSFSAEGAEEIVNAVGTNLQIEINLNPQFVQANLPATYGSLVPPSLAWGCDTLSVSLFGGAVTGERIYDSIFYNDTVDAFGTMLMPNGSTYNVLRQKHTEIDYENVYADFAGTWTSFERIITYKNQYDWYTNGVGYILAEMDMSPTFDTIVDVIWDTTAPPIIPVTVAVNVNTTNVSCNGGSNGTATASVSGGVTPYTYLWQPGGLTSSSVNGLNAGTYTLTVSDNNDSTSIENVTITEPPALGASGFVTNISCNGGNNGTGSASVSGGTSPYTYLWNDANSQTTVNATGLSAGTYSVMVSDSCGGSSTATAVITEPAAISITADSTNATMGNCDGSAWAIVSGGTAPYTYSWTGGLTTDTITNQCAANYCCTVTDANGCTNSICTNITVSTGTNKLTAGSGAINTYPNPNNGKFTIEMTNGKGIVKNIEVFNILGEQIYFQSGITNPIMNIDLSSQPAGVYLYRVLRENGSLIGEGKIAINK